MSLSLVRLLTMEFSWQLAPRKQHLLTGICTSRLLARRRQYTAFKVQAAASAGACSLRGPFGLPARFFTSWSI
jgi:hypothetical protein